MTKHAGKIYLVGAGPGDEGLITVRGLECIRKADVIVYDRLVGEGLLEHRKPDCRLIYVGKSPAGHTMPQEKINQLLVQLGREGRSVVRLKGGDPFLFGRGGEEALELLANGIPFEVVPGVTSALAGPAAVGIPVTHRGVSAGVTIVTGHEDPSKDVAQVDWRKLAAAGETLVIMMGVGNLPVICEKLMSGGRDPATPVAVIRHATFPHQRVVTSTLANVAEEVRERGLRSPAVIVVGDVVRLRERLAPRESKPLAGQRVLVTRPAEQAEEFAELLSAAGAEPIVFPLISIVPSEDTGPLRDALSRLNGFDWLIFTSTNGVRHVAPHLEPFLADPNGPSGLPLKTAVVGPRTARTCGELGLHIDFMPSRYTVESIVAEFPERVAGKKMLLLRAREASPELPKGLAEAGAEVEEITVYRTEPVTDRAEDLRQLISEGGVDAVTLMSSSTVKSLIDQLGPEAPRLLSGVRVGCLGHVTAATFQELAGRPPDVVARTYTMQGLIQALAESQKEPQP